MNKGPAAVFMRSVAGFPKLLVAALNGPAVGVAVTLLCHVDMAYAAPGATLWTPFFRMAIVPEFASSTLFPEVMVRACVCVCVCARVCVFNVDA
jgi:enoyl-CoA hydratase/carnithine racemase